MTQDEFEKLNDGDPVWFEPTYFHFPIRGTIRTLNGEKGVFINFYGDALAQFIPHTPSFYDSVTAYSKDGKPPKHKHGVKAAFPVSPYKSEPGYVFVERKVMDINGDEDTIWEKIPANDAKEDDTIIQCAIATCNQPAVQLDHSWPYEIHDTRCKAHLHTPIDEKCYSQHGILSPCCKEHHHIQNLRDSIEARIKWLLTQHDEESHSLAAALTLFYVHICRYIKYKWPNELLSCQK